MSGFKKMLDQNFVWNKKMFEPKLVYSQTLCPNNFILRKHLLDSKLFEPNILFTNNFVDPNVFGADFLLIKYLIGPKIIGISNFWENQMKA